MIKQEDYSRRENQENLRFNNILEGPQETVKKCTAKVKEILHELGLAPEEIRFHAIHRIGKVRSNVPNNDYNDSAAANNVTNTQAQAPRATYPLPVIARFVWRMDVEWVWEKRKDLSIERPFLDRLYRQDLSPESAKRRGKLRATFKKAKKKSQN